MIRLKCLIHVLILFVLLLESHSFAGPACERIDRKISESVVDGYTIQIFSYNCKEGVQMYKDEIAAHAKILDSGGQIIENEIGGWILEDNGSQWQPPSEIKIAAVPDGFPYLVFQSSNYSSSNINHSYILYSTTPTLKKVAIIKSPINHYQSSSNDGSEYAVVGFYTNLHGDYLIDRLVPDNKVAECNACQGYDIETVKVTKDRVTVFGRRPFGRK